MGKKDLDYVLDELVGGFGKWQLYILLVIMPVSWIGGYPLFLSLFAAYQPKHRCFIEGCDNEHHVSDIFAEGHLDFAIPREHASSNFLTEAAAFDPCHSYERSQDTNNATCLPSDFDTSQLIGCKSYVWDSTYFEETLATQFELVCDNDYKRKLLSSCLMAGLLIGSLIGGYIGDKLGRKRAMFLAALVVVPSTLLGGFVPNYECYALLRVVVCACLPVMWVAGHAYGLELFSPRYRRTLIAIKDIPISTFLLTAIIHWNRQWQRLHVWVSLLCCVGLPVYFLVPESPRWLAGNRRHKEAEDVFLMIGKGNGRKLNKEQKEELRQIVNDVEKETEESLSPFDMFRPEHLIKTLILLLQWVTTCVGFYALTLNSTQLHGDPVWNYLLLTLVDMPMFVVLYFAMDGIGRRPTLALSQFFLGGSCLLLAFVPKDQSMSILIYYLVGKAASGISFTMVYLITAELYPTNLRAQAVGTCSAISRVFGLGAGFVSKLAVYWTPLPMLILGIPTVVAAFLALALTETSGKDLPQTMLEAEVLDQAEAHLEGPRENAGFEKEEDHEKHIGVAKENNDHAYRPSIQLDYIDHERGSEKMK